MVGIEAGGAKDLVAPLRDLHHGKAVAVEMAAQRGQDAGNVDSDHEA